MPTPSGPGASKAGTSKTGASEPIRPWAWAWSLRLGVLGALLVVGGLLTNNEGIAVAGIAAGTLSLISVLVWRSQLIDQWRRDHRGPAESPPGTGLGPT